MSIFFSSGSDRGLLDLAHMSPRGRVALGAQQRQTWVAPMASTTATYFKTPRSPVRQNPILCHSPSLTSCFTASSQLPFDNWLLVYFPLTLKCQTAFVSEALVCLSHITLHRQANECYRRQANCCMHSGDHSAPEAFFPLHWPTVICLACIREELELIIYLFHSLCSMSCCRALQLSQLCHALDAGWPSI